MFTSFLSSVASGNWHTILGAAALLILANFSGVLIAQAGTQFTAAVNWAIAKLSARPTQDVVTASAEAFLAHVRLALNGHAHLDAAIHTAVTGNSLGKADLLSFLEAVWQDVQDNTDIHTWQDLGHALIPNYTTAVPIESVIQAAKSRFLIAAPSILVSDVGRRGMTVRASDFFPRVK